MDAITIGLLALGGIAAMKSRNGMDATVVNTTTGQTSRKVVSKTPLGSLRSISIADFQTPSLQPVIDNSQAIISPSTRSASTPVYAPTSTPLVVETSPIIFPVQCFFNCGGPLESAPGGGIVFIETPAAAPPPNTEPAPPIYSGPDIPNPDAPYTPPPPADTPPATTPTTTEDIPPYYYTGPDVIDWTP